MSSDRLIRTVARLEFQMELLKDLVDPELDPFAFLVFENRWSREQYHDILGLMDALNERILKGIQISKAEFERTIYEIIPRPQEDYHLPENIVRDLMASGKYEAVYEEMKRQGMNI